MLLPKRLGKFVRESTTFSNAKIQAAARAGRLRVVTPEDGDVAGDDLQMLVFEQDRVLFDGNQLSRRTQHYHALLNKPHATTCTTRDPDDKRDLSNYLARMPAGTFPVGRLDRDTTGVLLFTTDGDLASAMLRPEHDTDKLYWLWLNEEFEADDPRLAQLTCRSDPRYLGAKTAKVLNRTEHSVELLITISEGKNRQIRRMCRALDLRLLHLHRKHIGVLTDDALAVGEFRTLTPTEVQALWASLGGRASVQRRQLEALLRRNRLLNAQETPNPRLQEWLSAHYQALATGRLAIQ